MSIFFVLANYLFPDERFKRISSFTGAKLVKKSKRFLFAYHFFAINYENVYDNFPYVLSLNHYLSLTFYCQLRHLYIKKTESKSPHSLYIIRYKRRKRGQKQSYTTNVVVRMPLLCDFTTRFFAVPLHRQSEIINNLKKGHRL